MIAPPAPSDTASGAPWLPGSVQIGTLTVGLLGHAAWARAARARTAARATPRRVAMGTPRCVALRLIGNRGTGIPLPHVGCSITPHADRPGLFGEGVAESGCPGK